MMKRHFLMALCALLAAATAMAQSNRLIIQDFEIAPDSTVTIPVTLVNEDISRGMQFNLTVPEGLTIEDMRVTKCSKSLGMSLTYSDKSDTKIIVLYQMGKSCFPPDSADVALIEFRAAHDFKGGELSVWKGRGSTMDNDPFIIEGDTAVVAVPAASLILINPTEEQYYK